MAPQWKRTPTNEELAEQIDRFAPLMRRIANRHGFPLTALANPDDLYRECETRLFHLLMLYEPGSPQYENMAARALNSAALRQLELERSGTRDHRRTHVGLDLEPVFGKPGNGNPEQDFLAKDLEERIKKRLSPVGRKVFHVLVHPDEKDGPGDPVPALRAQQEENGRWVCRLTYTILARTLREDVGEIRKAVAEVRLVAEEEAVK